ncbi:tetratricopeptide repeat protein [Actinoplanes sp. NPDC026670]|uniref:tetratricopeptide repeat protein n=1 Tax=Actinoplanes sp. NPDC026670 TaxID=3154700 RepID=UPI0033FC36C7
MVKSVSMYEVFIASPGGLADERAAVRDEVENFNRHFMNEIEAAFSARGWEDVPGGVGRPQEIINDLVRRSDYMILILGSRWGTEPASDGRFSSGTEEEFNLAKSLIPDQDQPMQDILVLFKGVPEAQLRDPGEQLSKVLSFKKELEDSRFLMYKTFDDIEALKNEVRSKMHGWARERRSGVQASRRSLASRQVRDTSDVIESNPQTASFLANAESYEAKGLMTQAEAAYAKAIADDDVASLEKYARFLRRTGRLARSLEINRRILDQLASADDTDATIDKRVRILVGIGITQRKMGDLRGSKATLHEAIQTADTGGVDAQDVLGYALDNLGITADRSGDPVVAVNSFRRAFSIRQGSGDGAGQARSLTNLARIHKKSGNLDSALEECNEAIVILESLQDKPALAAAYAAKGEILEANEEYSGAEKFYSKALRLNEQLGVPDNIAMSQTQVARMMIEHGQLDQAQMYAESSLEENERNSNREGIASSKHLLGRVMGAIGNDREAFALLEESADLFASMKNPNGEAWARYHLAVVQRKMGLNTESDISIARARALSQVVGNAQLKAQTSEF